MLVTFGKEFTKHLTIISLEGLIQECVRLVSNGEYAGNVECETRVDGPRRVRFTLKTRSSHAYGSRRSASGRAMPKASWEAHRDIMRLILTRDPTATIKASLATYRGLDDFEANFPATAHHNIGSMFHPCYMPDCSIPKP